MLRSRIWMVVVAVLALSACGGNDQTEEGISSVETTSSDTNDLTGLSLAEITPLTFANGRSSIQLGEEQAGGTYLLIVNAANKTPANYTLQLSDLSLPSLSILQEALEVETPETPEAEFHQYLREMETILPETEEPAVYSQLSTLATKTLATGDKTTFKVLSSMSSLSQYKKVEAELRVATDNIYVYVESANADLIETDKVQALADEFENVILPRDRSLFGTESDINGDGHITILLSCVTNGMATSGGIVTGFFFPGDLYAPSNSNPASNEQEIFYTLLPDPEGRCGVPISVNFAIRNILPGVLAHEFQHMISFNQHVLVNEEGTEEPWLNEGLSHLAEDLTGFGQENPSRAKLFLDQPNNCSLIPSSSPRLCERGASYLLLRYLYEQFPGGNGDPFIQNLSEGSRSGLTNLVAAFGEGDDSFDEFSEFLSRWSIALALSGTGITDDPKYNYQPRGTHPETGIPTGVCLRCEAQDGRGTISNGPTISNVDEFPMVTNLYSSASQFFLINGAPESLSINSAGNPTLTGSILRLER